MEAMASVRLSQAMVVLLFIPMVAAALSTEPLKVLLDMVVMDMVVTTARGLLMLMQDMVDMGLLLSMFPRLTMDMATTHNLSPMVTILARGLLMLDTMVVLALMSTRPVLTTMDLTDMVSTTTARGQLMLDILVMEVMEWLAATSKLTGHTLPMVSVLPTLTK